MSAFSKRVSKFWTHRFPMTCNITSSIGKVKMSNQLHNQFRDSPIHSLPFDIIKDKKVIPLSPVGIKSGRPPDSSAFSAANFFRVRFSLIHDFLENNLHHCNVITPRSGLSLWLQPSRVLDRLSMRKGSEFRSVDVKITSGLEFKYWTHFGMFIDPRYDLGFWVFTG